MVAGVIRLTATACDAGVNHDGVPGHGKQRGCLARRTGVYLDGQQAHAFAPDYNGIAPVEPVQVENWQVRADLAGLARK
jgi:hypothetical protein